MGDLDSTQLATFATVVHEGSLESAARALHVTPSAVSQRIKALEQAVGQVLLRRGRPCTPTEAGRPLLRLSGQVALLEREALHAARGPLTGAWDRTRVAVVVNADSLATWFLPALAAITGPDRCGGDGGPAPAFEIREDDQEHTADLLRDGSVMAAVTAQHEPVQGCRVERLGAMRYVAVAAPDYRRRHLPGDPADARAVGQALVGAPTLAFSRKDRLQHRFLRSLVRREVDPPVHYVPSVWGFNEALRLGFGWALVPEQLAGDDLNAGRYVEITPGRHLDVSLYWQHWRLESAILAELTAAVRRAAAAALR